MRAINSSRLNNPSHLMRGKRPLLCSLRIRAVLGVVSRSNGLGIPVVSVMYTSRFNSLMWIDSIKPQCQSFD